MELNLAHLWHSMGLPSRVVALSLATMAILSLGVLFERLLFLARTVGANRAFAQKAAALMKTSDLVELTKEANAAPRAPLATLLHAGAFKFLEYVETEEDNHLSSIDATKREMTRKAEVVSSDLRRGLSLLASIGSLAPFVGLLGTVLGILNAFAKIGATGSGGLGAVSMGIAEALYETAFGLFVAIPSVAFFNYLSGKVDSLERDLTNATG
ncbi:MAG: MotA/TolQ/ExbB proton channel family protein, partial [Polyangiales bacterium]